MGTSSVSKRGVITPRFWTVSCGGHLLTAIPSFDVVDVFAATIPDFPFTPALHVHYAETVLPMRDGLPKFKGYPASFGGSDEMMAE